MSNLSFKPKNVVKRLVAVLPERARDVIDLRYGLSNGDRQTLESIGQKYGITRERVRQIENYAIRQIIESEIYKKEKEAFDELEKKMHEMGGVVPEDEFLHAISADDEVTKNHVHFMLVLGHAFEKEKEDLDFVHRWHVDPHLAEKVHSALKKLYENLSDDSLIPESELLNSFLDHLQDVSSDYRDDEMVKRWLRLSKKIDKNPLGEWGVSRSSSVNLKGIRDYAYLVLREHGSPLHFTEVAKRIEELFEKKAHTATTHNELIRDDRFVLVGRGLYALKEWGYMTGVVKDVIAEILEKNGPLTKDEIIEKVLKERYVKQNTIIVNLQDGIAFSKDEDGRYHLVK